MKAVAQARNKPRAATRSASRIIVHFEYADMSASMVCLAGSFNNWRPERGRMVRLENGKWVKDLVLSPGTYEYRFVVDGQWVPDPNADHTATNPFGERNSLLTVRANTAVGRRD